MNCVEVTAEFSLFDYFRLETLAKNAGVSVPDFLSIFFGASGRNNPTSGTSALN